MNISRSELTERVIRKRIIIFGYVINIKIEIYKANKEVTLSSLFGVDASNHQSEGTSGKYSPIDWGATSSRNDYE